MLSITMKDMAVLRASYMPFIKGGGFFLPSKKAFKYGDDVFFLMTLMDEPEKIPITGKVVWVTPQGAQGNRSAGFGIQFSKKSELAKDKIETYLAGTLNSDKSTHTM